MNRVWFCSLLSWLASIVFAVIVLQAHLPRSRTIATVAECTFILSIIAHGLSAHPFVEALNSRLKRQINS